jgi:hypothetical protein
MGLHGRVESGDVEGQVKLEAFAPSRGQGEMPQGSGPAPAAVLEMHGGVLDADAAGHRGHVPARGGVLPLGAVAVIRGAQGRFMRGWSAKKGRSSQLPRSEASRLRRRVGLSRVTAPGMMVRVNRGRMRMSTLTSPTDKKGSGPNPGASSTVRSATRRDHPGQGGQAGLAAHRDLASKRL